MYREHAPDPSLRRQVACLWTVSGAGGASLVLPDGCVDVLFDLEAGTARWIGAMTAAAAPGPGGATLLGVRFRPGEAAAFLGDAMHPLTDRTAPFDPGLAARVAEAPTLAGRAGIVHAALHALRGARGADPAVRAAVALLEGGASVGATAAAVGLSPRQLERRFVERVGLGPKRFARAARLQRLVAAFGPARPDWAGLAARLGYADQGHLAREVRALCGVTPTALWRDRVGFVQGGAGADRYVVGQEAR